MDEFLLQPGPGLFGDDKPEALCFKDLGRTSEWNDGQQAVAGIGAFFIAADALGDAQAPKTAQAAACWPAPEFLKNIR